VIHTTLVARGSDHIELSTIPESSLVNPVNTSYKKEKGFIAYLFAPLRWSRQQREETGNEPLLYARRDSCKFILHFKELFKI